MTQYCNPAIKQLKDQQVRYAPKDVRIEQMQRAEQLLADIDPNDTYRYQEICNEITSYKPDRYPDLILTGEDALHDLRCFVEDLSDSVDLPAEEMEEPVLTVEDVSQKFQVSTKTVDRWRNRGLVSRRFKFGNRKRVGFLQSSVDRFARDHEMEVNRSSRFSQLSDDEKEDILRRARRMARYGACPAEISRRLARKLGRSPETIRYTLKNYDQEYPENAVFPMAHEPLTTEQKKEIFRKYRRGIPAERLATQHCRTKASIYRIVTEMRALRLMQHPIDFMDSDEFRMNDAEKFIMGPPPEVKKSTAKVKVPPGLPPYLASLYSIPLNYLKYQAAQLREELDPSRPKTKDIDRIEILIDQSLDVKNFLIRSNLRLVVSIAKRHIKPSSNFFEMVSDGNMSLIRAIEKFDYTKGNKFSTYASWAIMKNFARSIPAEHTILDRYRTGNDEVFQYSTDNRANQFQQELENKKQHQAIMHILDQLDGRERDIILQRYGLNQGTEPLTLEQVGNRFGVTKERIRQLEARALQKLRKIASQENLDIPGL